jgi:hypothetical protein
MTKSWWRRAAISYFAENTVPLHWKDYSIVTLQGNNRCFVPNIIIATQPLGFAVANPLYIFYSNAFRSFGFYCYIHRKQVNHCDVISTRRFHGSVIIVCGVAWLCVGQTAVFPKGIATNRRSEHTTRLHVVQKIENQALKMLAHRSTFVETCVRWPDCRGTRYETSATWKPD